MKRKRKKRAGALLSVRQADRVTARSVWPSSFVLEEGHPPPKGKGRRRRREGQRGRLVTSELAYIWGVKFCEH